MNVCNMNMRLRKRSTNMSNRCLRTVGNLIHIILDCCIRVISEKSNSNVILIGSEKMPKQVYKRITKDDVYALLVGTSLDFMNPIGGAISLVHLAKFLNTSRYQVKKYIDQLLEVGFVELKMFIIPDEEELYPPYWGYRLTEKGKETTYYKTRYDEHEKIFNECFNISNET